MNDDLEVFHARAMLLGMDYIEWAHAFAREKPEGGIDMFHADTMKPMSFGVFLGKLNSTMANITGLAARGDTVPFLPAVPRIPEAMERRIYDGPYLASNLKGNR